MLKLKFSKVRSVKTFLFSLFSLSAAGGLYLLFSLGILTSCNTTEPKPSLELELKLELLEVSCTEAWLQLTTNNLQLPAEVNLLKNDTTSQSFSLSTKDTLLYIDSLLPNQTYQFKSSVLSSQSTIISNQVEVKTMDTTSHNFTFQSWTFGTIGSSVLYDVAIINENDIWAVGEIMIADTSINGYTTYNAVHWDGQSWEFRKIGGYGTWPCHSVFAFSANDIWFEGNIHWDGSNYTVHMSGWPLMPNGDNWQVNKLWGSSSSDLYAVGNGGNIAHWDGVKWSKIESGTDVNINDVFGVIDQFTDQRKVFCAVSFVLQLGEHKILTIDENNKVDSLPWNTGRRVNSTWSNKGRIVYTSGGGVFQNKLGDWQEETSIPLYYTNRIRGNGLNDIFTAGDFGLLAHYNGTDWNIYEEFLFVASSLSLTVNGDIIASVGRQGAKALLIVGKRI